MWYSEDMENINLNNAADKILGVVEELERLLDDIEERHLYEESDAAKLAKIKAKFAATHLKLREQQKAKQSDIKMTTNEEVLSELGTGEVECFDHEAEFSDTPHVLPAAKLFPNEKTKFDREL